MAEMTSILGKVIPAGPHIPAGPWTEPSGPNEQAGSHPLPPSSRKPAWETVREGLSEREALDEAVRLNLALEVMET